MRFLADENFDGLAVKALITAGHDVVWINDVAPGIPDEDVWDRAVKESRILLTDMVHPPVNNKISNN